MAGYGSQLQGGSGLFLQGGASPRIQGSTIPVQTTVPGTVIQPAVAPGNQTLVRSGGGGGGSAPKPAPVYVDPWASTPWGSKANYDKAVSDYTSAKDLAYGSINDLIGDTATKYNSGVLDYIDQLKSGQRAIDRNSVQNEMSREQGRLGVLDLVGTGLRSGAVTLNNAGATNSSAAEQLGKAYGDIGRKEMTKVGNEYSLGQENIKGQQEDLDQQTATFQRKSQESKTSAVNSIVQTASDKLAQLNAAAQGASLPDRIAIEQEKTRIRNDALARLSAFDATLTNGINSNRPASVETNRAEAQRLLTAGTAPENTFDFTSSIPAAFQGTGPFASALPIFTTNRYARDQGA